MPQLVSQARASAPSVDPNVTTTLGPVWSTATSRKVASLSGSSWPQMFRWDFTQTEEQLETMRCGGNKNARAFFRANGVRDLHIRQDTKYSSSTAKAYRAKLAKEVQAALAGGRRKEATAAPAPAAEPSFFDDFEPTVPTRTASAPQISTLEQTASPPSPAPEAVNFRAVPSPKAKPVVPIRLRKASAVGSGATLSASGLSASGLSAAGLQGPRAAPKLPRQISKDLPDAARRDARRARYRGPGGVPTRSFPDGRRRWGTSGRRGL